MLKDGVSGDICIHGVSFWVSISAVASAFPLFITHCMPEFLGGIVLGTLLITVIIGGSGLTLGSSTILVRDVFMKINPSLSESAKNLKVSRLTIIGILYPKDKTDLVNFSLSLLSPIDILFLILKV